MRDNRNKLWVVLEKDVQKRARNKDSKFVLKGPWKKFIRDQEGFKIFSVDGTWVRNNLCVYFAHGGHGLVFEFIPLNEIWIATHHFHEGKSEITHCSCKTKNKKGPISQAFFESTVIHEIFEFRKMKKDLSYWDAHNLALKEEKRIGILKDPYIDK